MPRPARTSAIAATALLAASLLAGCGSSGSSTCGPVTRDALDPGSLNHVLPGAPTPSYLTDPPTSGAHQPTPSVSGAQTRPIDPQIQVGILEEGHVLIQYHGLDPAAVATLRRLASSTVVVAPATSLPGDAEVIATAWVTRQVCSGLDPAAMRSFARTRTGKGPGRP